MKSRSTPKNTCWNGLSHGQDLARHVQTAARPSGDHLPCPRARAGVASKGMRETCHRCGGDLPDVRATGDGPSAFCPHCGAPQLLLTDYSEPLATGAEAATPDGTSSTGTLPPPRPNRVDWPTAVGGATLVSVVAVVLSVVAALVPDLTPIGSVWVVSCSLTTLALYQRRRPLAAMNANVGARIGLLVGTILVVFLAATLSAGLCVARYKLHALSTFDVDMSLAMKAQIDQLSASRPLTPDKLAMIGSPQFRAAMMLSTFSILLFLVLLISVFGGAVGGLLRTRRFGRKA